MSLFNCSSCADTIPLLKPRIQCRICYSHDLCANCYVLGIYTGTHREDHTTVLHKKSETVLKPPPLPPRRVSATAPEQLPSRPAPGRNVQPQGVPKYPSPQSQPPTGPPASTKSPVGPSPSSSPQIQGVATPQFSPAPPQPSAGPPPSHPQISGPGYPLMSRVPSREPSGGPPPSAISNQQGWKPFFDGCNPTPTGIAFLNSVFDCLDSMKAGMLAPEQYSAFLDVQCYRLEEDVWKRSNKPTFGAISEDLADYELRTVFENFTIEHVLRPRAAPPNNDLGNMVSSLSGSIGRRLSSQLASSLAIPRISGGMMPMVTRKGFIDITTIELLGEPARGPLLIDRIVRYYPLKDPWSQWGDCPRQILPDEIPKELAERVARISAFSKRQAAERIEAKRVELAFRQQGRQNALDLLDPPGTKYVYRY